MDKQTSKKLNDTLEKMGAIDNGNSSSKSTSSEATQSSDMSFYIIMLALIVGMGFYISYDSEQRYGNETLTAAATPDDSTQGAVLLPVIVSIEKVETVDVKPVAVIPATETTPKAVLVEKIEQKTIITKAVIEVEEAVATVAIKEPTANEQSTATAAEAVVAIVAPVEAKPVQAAPAPMPAAIPMVESMMQTADMVAAPVVKAAEEVTETVQAVVEAAPMAQPAQAYNPYGYQYQPQNNYYQPQPQNNYYQPQRQYGNPYGYGNPYQQPSQ